MKTKFPLKRMGLCHKVIFIVQINHGIIEDIMISKTFVVCTLVYTSS